MSTAVPSAARDAILAWYAERGRPLAFRRTTDPYAILVSESMAQQTQAARAAEYWERFMARFPTVDTLASATPADVLRAWAGLGYDRRALALWRSARVIVEVHDGRVPKSVKELETLQGVGPYTARAIASIAYGVPVGAVDVNVRRVLTRIVAGDVPPLPAATIQAIADGSVPTDAPGAWTHAVMDVGATLCKPRIARCDACPARPWCRYAQEAAQATRPTAGPPPADTRPRPARDRAVRDRAAPFPSTNRWLRGRILDRLRTTPGDAWATLESPIGEHGHERVRAAAHAMANDGVLELEARGDDVLRARLPLA